jgi:hypothetical protein
MARNPVSFSNSLRASKWPGFGSDRLAVQVQAVCSNKSDDRVKPSTLTHPCGMAFGEGASRSRHGVRNRGAGETYSGFAETVWIGTALDEPGFEFGCFRKAQDV